MNLTVKITEQVEKKLEAVLKGRYDNKTIWMYYKVSLQMLRDIIENLIACHHTTYTLAAVSYTHLTLPTIYSV